MLATLEKQRRKELILRYVRGLGITHPFGEANPVIYCQHIAESETVFGWASLCKEPVGPPAIIFGLDLRPLTGVIHTGLVVLR